MDTVSKEFKDVTIYTPGFWSNIVRIDAKWARIGVGPYAQHKECVHGEYIEKGKRKPQNLVSYGYVVVVPTAHAIQPDDLYLPFLDGASSSPTRYSMADSRWRTDFDEQLLSSNVPILADYRSLRSDSETEAPAITGLGIAVVQLPTLTNDAAMHGKSEGVEFENVELEYEEGRRYQEERSLFQRDPRLVQQAKDFYGCVCQVCGFDFAKIYGVLGQDFAEMHHLNPLSERPPEEQTSAVRTNLTEVAVLCANCHRMIHRLKPALSVEQLKARLFSDSEARGVR